MQIKNLKRISRILLKQLGDIHPEDILGMLGVEKKRSASNRILPTLGIFSLGLITGISAGFFLTTKMNEFLQAHMEHEEDAQPKDKE